MVVIKGMRRLLRVCGGYIGMWRLYLYVAVILICGGYIGMWLLYWYVAVILDNCTSRAALGS